MKPKSLTIFTLLASMFMLASYNTFALNVEEQQQQLNKALLEAAKTNNAQEVIRLLDQGADINYADNRGLTAFTWAARNGHANIVRMLIEHGAKNVNQLLVALLVAANNQHADVVRLLLLNNSPMVSATNRYRNIVLNLLGAHNVSPLSIAIMDRNGENIAQILASLPQADIDAQDDFGITALHWAAARNDEQTVNALLKRNANVNIRDNDGNTPLHYAARNGHLNIVRALLTHNAQVNLFNNQNESAWILALRNNHPEIADLLARYASELVYGQLTRAGRQAGEFEWAPTGASLPPELAALVAQHAMGYGAAPAPSGPPA